MKRKGTLLVVDDEPYVLESLAFLLDRNGYRVRTAPGAAEALKESLLDGIDLAITDLRMPGLDGLGLLRSLTERHPGLPVVILTAHATVPTAVECVRAGAADFLQKPADPDKLLLVVERVLEEARRRRELAYLRADRGTGGRRQPVGSSQAWRKVVEMAKVAAPTDASVLILGESGTGKEEVARLIHRSGPRAERAFVRVNCAAIPVELFESEFFGHRKGAFTGAFDDREGRFRVADKGSLLLDEIALMPLAAQAKVLRTLEDGLFERVGETQSTAVDVRIIAATNADLAKEVEGGSFRRDLYYRLNVLTIEIPPLRERKADIDDLAHAFAEEFIERTGKAIEGIEEETLEALRSYHWPGNARELRNVIERAVILETEGRIRATSLPREVLGDARPSSDLNLRQGLAAEERRLLEEALRVAGGVRREAARLLGIDERNMSYFLKKHDLFR